MTLPTAIYLLEEIYAPVQTELTRVPERIRAILESDNPLIEDVVRHFFSAHGKMLRPAMTWMGAKTVNTADVDCEAVGSLAASYEIFHAATLIHDDIIDSADLRRNLQTVHTKWGADTAVLVGDFLHDRALQTIFKYGSREVMQLFLETAGVVCDGEIHEVFRKRTDFLSEEEYFEIIRKKTASLLACVLESGGRAAGANDEQALALRSFGNDFGMAFQIIDDCLDFVGSTEEFGKTLGKDLEEGVLTLPLIHLLGLTGTDQEKVFHLIQNSQTNSAMEELVGLLQSQGSLEYSFKKAGVYAERAYQAIEDFDDSPAKASLSKLVGYVISRTQ